MCSRTRTPRTSSAKARQLSGSCSAAMAGGGAARTRARLDQLPIRVQERAQLFRETHNACCALLKLSACGLEDNRAQQEQTRALRLPPSGSQSANA